MTDPKYMATLEITYGRQQVGGAEQPKKTDFPISLSTPFEEDAIGLAQEAAKRWVKSEKYEPSPVTGNISVKILDVWEDISGKDISLEGRTTKFSETQLQKIARATPLGL